MRTNQDKPAGTAAANRELGQAWTPEDTARTIALEESRETTRSIHRQACELQRQQNITYARAHAELRAAWEEGIRLARSYGDNIHHLDGEQKEQQWLRFIAKSQEAAQ